MFTNKRLVLPNFKDPEVRQLAQVLFDYWLSLEQKDALAIQSGSVDATPIGANSPSTGAFTTLTANSTIGLATGAGGTVTQATNKATAVTLNKSCGLITMNNALLAAGATVRFQLNSSVIGQGDIVLVQGFGGFAAFGTYDIWAENPIAGAVQILLRNTTGGGLSEAVQLHFMVLQGVEA